jgi:hypothetical protein
MFSSTLAQYKTTVYDMMGNPHEGFMIYLAFETSLMDYPNAAVFTDEFDLFFNTTTDTYDTCSQQAIAAGNYQNDDGAWCEDYDYCTLYPDNHVDFNGNDCPPDACASAMVTGTDRFETQINIDTKNGDVYDFMIEAQPVTIDPATCDTEQSIILTIPGAAEVTF